MNKKGLTLITILFLITLAIGGYLVYQTISTPTRSQQAVQTSTKSDKIEDWKVYTNTKYGFTFKYPSDLTPDESRSTAIDKPLIDFYDESGSAPHLEWNLYVHKKPVEKVLSDLIEGQNKSDPTWYKYQVISQEPFIKDNKHKGYTVKTKDQSGEKSTIIIPIDSSTTVIFQSLGFDIDTFYRILSTFKFL